MAHDIFENKWKFEAFFKNNYPTLCRIAKAYFKDEDLVEDVVCETFIKLWNNRYNIQIQTSLQDYLIRSLINTCIDFYRKEKVYKERMVKIDDELCVYNTLADLDQSPLDYLMTKEQQEIIYKAIEKLPARYKETFQLIRIEGHSYEEVAEIMNISKNTVKSNLREAMNILKDKLKDLTFIIFLVASILSFLFKNI